MNNDHLAGPLTERKDVVADQPVRLFDIAAHLAKDDRFQCIRAWAGDPTKRMQAT